MIRILRDGVGGKKGSSRVLELVVGSIGVM